MLYFPNLAPCLQMPRPQSAAAPEKLSGNRDHVNRKAWLLSVDFRLDHMECKELFPTPPPQCDCDVAFWWAGLRKTWKKSPWPSGLVGESCGNPAAKPCCTSEQARRLSGDRRPEQSGNLPRQTFPCRGKGEDAQNLSGPGKPVGKGRRLFNELLGSLLPLLPSLLLITMAPLGAMANEPETDNIQKDSIVQASSDQSASNQENPSDIKDFSDIQDPDHWAYEQLEKLVKDKCVAGFYNESTGERTFQGDEAATRYEIATLLNHCLEISPRFSSLNIENTINNAVNNINNKYTNIYISYYISFGLIVGLSINNLLSIKFEQDSNKQTHVKILELLAAPAISALISVGAASLNEKLNDTNGPSAASFLQDLQKSEIVIQNHTPLFGQHFT